MAAEREIRRRPPSSGGWAGSPRHSFPAVTSPPPLGVPLANRPQFSSPIGGTARAKRAGMLMGAPAATNGMGTVSRCLVLAGLLGAAFVSAWELYFSIGWLAPLLAENDLGMDARMALLEHVALGGIGGFGLGLVALSYASWQKIGLGEVERGLWIASPLVLLPAGVVVTCHLAWRGEPEELLPVVLVSALALEVLLYRTLCEIPEKLSAIWRAAAASAPAFWRKHGPWLTVVLAALFYAVFMSFYTLRWHYKLKTANFDLSINNNLIFGALHGKFLVSPVTMPENPEGYAAVHVKLGQYVLLPIYALYPRPETLLVLQSSLLGLGAIPLYGFARRHISRWMAVAVAVAYLCYYPMHSANFYEVKYVPIATFFVLATIWAVDAKRWGWFAVAFVSAALMREDIPIGLAVVGTFLLLTGHRPRVGLLMAVVSAAWFVYLRFFWMEQQGEWWFPDMYKGLWAPGEQGFKSVIKTLLSNPTFVLLSFIKKKKLYYLLHLLVPIVFLPARRWYLWAAFIPGIILTLLATNYDPPTMYSFQYVMHWTPYVFVGSALALAALRQRPDGGRARAWAATGAMLFGTGLLQYNYGAFPTRDGSLQGGYKTVDFGFSDAERQRYANLQEIIQYIPRDATVAATEYVGPHVSSRLVLYSARYGPHGAEFYLVSSKELDLKQTKPKLRKALEQGSYGVLKRVGDFALLKQGLDPKDNEQLLKDWGLK